MKENLCWVQNRVPTLFCINCMVYNLVLQYHQAWPALMAPQVPSLIHWAWIPQPEPLPPPNQWQLCKEHLFPNVFSWLKYTCLTPRPLNPRSNVSSPLIRLPVHISQTTSSDSLFSQQRILLSWHSIHCVEITLYMPDSCSKLLALLTVNWGLGPVFFISPTPFHYFEHFLSACCEPKLRIYLLLSHVILHNFMKFILIHIAKTKIIKAQKH